MSTAGAGFSQGFSSTLFQGLQIMQANKQKQEELKVQRDLADASLKLHNAQTEQITQKMTAAAKLAARMMPQGTTLTEPGGGGGGTPESVTTTTPPAPLTMQERMGFAAQLGDFKDIFTPHFFDPSKGLAQFDPSTGTSSTVAQPQRPSLKDMLMQANEAVAGMNGGAPASGAAPSAAPVPEGAAPTAPMAAPGGAPTSPGPAAGPAVHFIPTVKMDKDGNVSVDIAGHQTNFQLQHQTIQGPNDTAQIVETVFDPVNGRVVNRYPIGAAVPAEKLQQAQMAVRSFAPNLDPASPIFGRAVADVTAAMLLPPDAQALRLAGIEAKLASLVGGASPGGAPAGKAGAPPQPTGKGAPKPAGSLGEAITQAEQQKVDTAAAKAGAEEAARVANTPLQGTDRTKVQQLLAVERGSQRVLELFNKDFVGKGFGQYSQELQTKMGEQEKAASQGRYTSGALAGSIREFTGKISPQEVEFRKTLLDISDMLLRARSGAQINEQEYSRLKGILASLTDEPNVFIPAMQRFAKEARTQIDDVLNLADKSPAQIRKTRPAPLTIPDGFQRVK